MSLRFKLVVIIVFAALVPLAISAFSTLGIHQQAFDEKVTEIHRMSAKAGAALVQAHLENYQKTLSRAIQAIQWPELSAAERDGALWLIYRQLDEIAVTSLLDENGQGLGPSVYLNKVAAAEELAGHPLATLAVLKRFSTSIPFADAKEKGTAIGETFVAPGEQSKIIPLAFGIQGHARHGMLMVAVGISLRQICGEVKKMSSPGTKVYLVDSLDRVVCDATSDIALDQVDPLIKRHTSGSSLSDLRYLDDRGEEILATVAPMAIGWAIVVEQSALTAFASSDAMWLQTGFWLVLSVIVATTTGLLLGRSISVPVQRLVVGASALAKGNFDHRLEVDGADELAQLSRTFNNMSEEIEKRDAEIRQWNRELQRRVDAQTLELREVQHQLLHSQKIAAVTSLGAGIAHEINNPLTGVIGLTQLMLRLADTDEPLHEHRDSLEMIETESRRIKKIVSTLQRFAQGYRGDDSRVLNIVNLIDSVISSFGEEVAKRNIQVVKDYESNLRKVSGNETALAQAFSEVLENACIAMPNGGQISICVSTVEDRVIKIVIEDTGRGISEENLEQIFEPFFTTKDNWRGEGLGLTMAFRTIEEHNGSIKAASKPGEGTTMTIFLPALKGGAHLE